MEEADLVEIPPPVNWNSKPKPLKRKEVLCPEIIDIDDYEYCPDLLPFPGKSAARDKGKQTVADFSPHYSTGDLKNAAGNDVKSSRSSYTGSHYSNEAYNDIIYVDDGYMGFSDNQMYDDQYTLLQSHFDELDIPPGIEFSVPWFTDDHVGTMDPFMGSASTHSASQVQIDHEGFQSWNMSHPMPWCSESEHAIAKSSSGGSSNPHMQFDAKKLKPYPEGGSMVGDLPNKQVVSGMMQSSSSTYAGKSYRKMEAPKASGLHAASDYGRKPQTPHEKVVRSSKNQYSTAGIYSRKMEAPKASGLHSASDCGKKPQTPHEKVVRSSKNQYSTAASSFPKAVMPIGNDNLYYPGLDMEGSMGSNFDLPGHNFNAWNPSTAPSYSSGNLQLSAGPHFGTFSYPTAHTSWLPYSMGGIQDLNAAGNSSKSSGLPCSKTVYENPEVFLKKFDIFKRFDTAEDHSDHFFSTSGAISMNQPSKRWSKKIQDEWRILEKDLPDTIFVRVYESRMDLLRAVIIGAEGTPYHDGLFFFDMFFPSNYPNVPPQVKYHSGGLRINPNLYDCGKVCLSLLNTWSGSQKEMWNPGVSTVLQVLVSIQGLILNAKPYFNEPGYEGTKGTFNGENKSLHYNETTFIYSLKTMVYSIRKPPKHFEDLVAGHYFKRAHDILAACRAYKNGNQVGSFVKGGVSVEKVNSFAEKEMAVENYINSRSRLQSFRKEYVVENAKNQSSSQSLKKELAVYLKTLVEAFAQVGVKDCDKFLS